MHSVFTSHVRLTFFIYLAWRARQEISLPWDAIATAAQEGARATASMSLGVHRDDWWVNAFTSTGLEVGYKWRSVFLEYDG